MYNIPKAYQNDLNEHYSKIDEREEMLEELIDRLVEVIETNFNHEEIRELENLGMVLPY